MTKNCNKVAQLFHCAVSKVFDRVKSVALWSANIRKLTKDHKGYGSKIPYCTINKAYSLWFFVLVLPTRYITCYCSVRVVFFLPDESFHWICVVASLYHEFFDRVLLLTRKCSDRVLLFFTFHIREKKYKTHNKTKTQKQTKQTLCTSFMIAW
jgi:hypothetical protein